MARLSRYRTKRNLAESPEPAAKLRKRKGQELLFVIQKHAARRLHYDFRLEHKGVLKSWAVPKGPSMNPKDKRLAIMVEDHPYDYKDFEGVIPKGYGAGTVMIWDHGTYYPEKSMEEGLRKGEIRVTLKGEKLKGTFTLVRINSEKNEWLLIKNKDDSVSSKDILALDRSVVSRATLEEIGGAPQSKMPHRIAPMLATLVEAPFDDKEWIFEIKWDGYRALAEVKKSNVFLYSRNFLSFNDLFPMIVEELQRLNVEAIFDGEIVVLDEKGISHFQFLQNFRKGAAPLKNLYYYVFDLLYLEGHDLRSVPLHKRKEMLKKVLEPLKNSFVRYTDHMEEKGTAFFDVAVKSGLEGIIGKRKESLYSPGKRSKEWVKIKRHLRQEAIICGFTEPRGSRKGLGALVLGLYKGRELKYIGHVGGGFTEKKLEQVKKLLTPLIQKKSPFKATPKTNAKVTWVKPQLLCEVTFNEWTSEGIMRQPIFLGIRGDKLAQTVIKEEPLKTETLLKKSRKVKLSNLDKIFWPKEKITKGDVLNYYESISSYLLPHLKDRPESLKRFPDGIDGLTFFQKNMQTYPSWIKTAKVQHHDKVVNYLLIQDLDSLLYAVNLGCIELHPFFSRIQSLDRPDFLVFDLDPEAISFDKVIEVAQMLHEVLEELDISSVCKTSGATGLHVCVPLHAKYTYEQAKDFSHMIALLTQKKIPKVSSLERIPKKRQKKVYIDYLQNNPGQTIASVYSIRALPGAPVSTPLKWSEVVKGMHPLDFTIHNTQKRLQKEGDLFKAVLGKGISMEKALKKLGQYQTVNG